MNNILISKDSKNKIRVVDISCKWNDKLTAYIIDRKTYQLDGKITQQPYIEISKGKSTRTITEQAELEFLSHIKKYLDKGYKHLSDYGVESIDKLDIKKIISEDRTDSNGFPKPMLAKQSDTVSLNTFEKPHYCSKKLDGIRCLMRWQDNEIKTASRGGIDYNIPTTYIRQDKTLIEFFKSHPDLILDGEIYEHGKILAQISGSCRKITLEEKHKFLKYYIYDLVLPDMKFEDRLMILQDMQNIFSNSKFIVILDHILTNSFSEIEFLHNKYVNEGYEGLIMRNPNKVYKPNGRGMEMLKYKLFSDNDYEIIGMNEGLREEDMVFVMKCDAGEFEAKPIGDRRLKQEYRQNINNLIGQFASIKHFGFTEKGIPNLPVFRSIKYDLEN